MRSRGALLLALVLAGCRAGPESARDTAPLATGPISYFQQRCARCHGPYGSFFSDAFGSVPAEVVAQKTDEMCRGQGGLALTGEDLAAQVEYQRSIQRKRPFIAVTGMDSGLLKGEVSPGASVELVGPSGRVAGEVQGHKWSVRMPAGAWRVEARVEGATAVLERGGPAYAPGGGAMNGF